MTFLVLKLSGNAGHVILRKKKIHDILQEITRQTPAKRVCLYKISNGGGVPKVGANLYCTAVYYEVVHPFNDDLLSRYESIPLDPYTVQLFADVYTSGSKIVEPQEIYPAGAFARLYEAENIACDILFLVCVSRLAIYMVSLSTDRVGKDLLTSERTMVFTGTIIPKLKKLIHGF